MITASIAPSASCGIHTWICHVAIFRFSPHRATRCTGVGYIWHENVDQRSQVKGRLRFHYAKYHPISAGVGVGPQN